jgi:CheY-like chemotaxis protein
MTRTLAGHIEDLDLDEVVRVIALSRRSGVLTVESSEGDAELGFGAGRLTSARRNDADATVAEVLVRAGVLLDADLAEGSAEAETLDDLLARAAEARPEDANLVARAEGVVAENLKATALQVMLYRAGHFSFRVSESDTTPPRYGGDSGFSLPGGLDADELAREAQRRRTGRRSGAMPRFSAGPRAESEDEPVDVLLVDDDLAFLASASRQASAAGLSASVLQSARAAVDALDQLEAHSERVMVVDLVMARPNGRGILGGLEVLRQAHERGLSDRVFLAFDAPHEDANNLADQLGAAGVLDKPRSSNGSLPPFAPFLNPVLVELGRPPLVDEPIDLVTQLRVELGEDDMDWREGAADVPEDAGRRLDVLKNMLVELNNPSFDEEIPLLVLRFASAFFSRGAIFAVHPERGLLAGVGGYGLTSSDTGRAVHSIRLPIDADTVFSRSLRENQTVRQPFYESEWNHRLVEVFGGPRPREVYTAPLLSNRGVEAILYADNALDPKPMPDLSLLEIFLQQSGAAIERWSMKQRLAAIDAAPSGA